MDLSQPSLYISLGAIAFNPVAWNIVARNDAHEYRNKTITRMFGGNPYAGTYFLAACIFGCGIIRDHLYWRALGDQDPVQFFPEPWVTIIPAALFGAGQLLVLTSIWALGITGTFLGDYFGILMDVRVEGFPFYILRDPMYVGSTMCFAATALWYERPAGLFITVYVYIVYALALKYEGPFTDKIYSNRAAVQTSAQTVAESSSESKKKL